MTASRNTLGDDRLARVILAVVGLSTFLGAMGFSIVAVALPEIGRHLEVSLEKSSWVMLSFLLISTAVMLPAGQAGDNFGFKRLFLGGFVVVALASLACGFSNDITLLSIARAFHGLGGAMVMAAGPALLTVHVAPSRRGEALGIVATATYAGLTLGPTIGGLLVSTLGWRSVFLFNVPIALLVLFVGGRYLPGRPANHRREGMDFIGGSLIFLATPAFLLPLATFARAGWLPWMGPSLLVGFAFVAALIWSQSRVHHPVLELSLFRSGTFVGAILGAICNYMALFGVILLVPFLLEEGFDYTTRQAGYMLSIQPLMMALSSMPAGRISDRIGTRKIGVIGMTIMGIGVALLATVASSLSIWLIGFGLALAGLGTGIFISPNSSALMGSAPANRQGVAAAIMAFSRGLARVS
jgi:EmrB/QacA subfamily drug resistance transporter